MFFHCDIIIWGLKQTIMKNELKWRLGKLPTPDEVTRLVNDKIITKEEARDILFKTDEILEVDSLKDEIKFLKDIIEKLSSSNYNNLSRYIIEYKPIYRESVWYPKYIGWTTCIGNSSYTTTLGGGYSTAGSNSITCGANTISSAVTGTTGTNKKFSEI